MLAWGSRGALLLFIGWGILLESRSSFLQSLLVSRLTRDASFAVRAGANPELRFPRSGPSDERLGYAELPSYLAALEHHDFIVKRQTVWSRRLAEIADLGGDAVYREKARAGLTLLDRAGLPLYAASYPERVYSDFAAIPPLIVATLLFIEDHSLLDPQQPRRNPAVDWGRFLLAAGGRSAGWIDPRLRQGGASTLATQIEKFRHSPEGRTAGIGEKLRQMMMATARTYLDGPNTMEARQRIVTSYLNATPLASRPGYGEIIGIGDGLHVWFGIDLAEASRALAMPSSAGLARKAQIYKEALSLLLAERRPAYYLIADRRALATLTDRYLDLLFSAGIIDAELHDAALKAKLEFRGEAPAPMPVSFVGRKAVDAVRTELLGTLRLPSLYGLDRLDLTATTTIDAAAQRRVSDLLATLGDREQVKALGLVGPKLLGTENPARVTYSVVLYERGADRNFVRIHADSLDEPFDINSGAKLILGSTAKLRTLISYLNVVALLHSRYATVTPRELQVTVGAAPDPLTRWAAEYLSSTADRSLRPMLEAAMQRRYSASPNESFFTAGGLHVFHNYEKSDDGKTPTVAEAVTHSINLAFIRLMRDLVSFYMAEDKAHAEGLSLELDEAARESYLKRFADEEGRTYLNRFYDDLHGRSAEEMLAILAGRTGPVARRLAVLFRSVRPEASAAEWHRFLAKHLPNHALDEAAVDSLYASYAIERYSLADRGYLAGIHPLELWLAAYLGTHAGASRGEILRASAAERQDVYRWLFKTHSAHKQDVRIRILQEEDAFNRILQDWRQQGYPFGHLVPSLATAIGSSGDRPEALARLIGILLNDGIELPTVDVERLQFAAATPYETSLGAAPRAARRVLAPEVAATVRQVLSGVVSEGTATRVRGAYRAADGSPLAIGGKTGTGDNRFESFGPGRRLIEARVVDRTATFVFYLGDRFFGTITAFVPGSEAAQYHFTSALAVQLLKALAPRLQPLLDDEAAERRHPH